MNLKHIIIFYPSFERGGATKNLVNLTNYFLKKNIGVSVISNGAKKKYFFKSKNLKILSKKISKKEFFFPLRWKISFQSFFQLYNFLKSKKKENTIIFSMQAHILAIIISKIFKKKIVIRLSEDPISATKYADEKFFSSVVFVSKILLYNWVDGIIAISKLTKASLSKFVSKKKIKLIYNPYLDSNKNISKTNKNYILSVGRLTKQKNFEFLIKVFNEFKYNDKKNIKLFIIGDGPKRDKIKLLIKNSRFSKSIKLFYWNKNLNKFYKNAKMFILPSLYEGLPNALIDAVNNNVPSISANVSGASDILLNGKGGYIFKINNKKELLEKINLILNNYNLAKKKSSVAKKFAYRFFNNYNCIKYLKYLKSIT